MQWSTAKTPKLIGLTPTATGLRPRPHADNRAVELQGAGTREQEPFRLSPGPEHEARRSQTRMRGGWQTIRFQLCGVHAAAAIWVAANLGEYLVRSPQHPRGFE